MALPNLPIQGQNPWFNERNAWDNAVDGELTSLDSRVDSVDTALTGRLSTATLDSRYVLQTPNALAVFFGSSNVVSGTWTEQFCTMMGFTGRNYAISGGSFTGAGPGAFSAQIATAVADSSLDKSAVKYVFLADSGNDMRSQATTATYEAAVGPALVSLRSAFPNARIILVPALWGITPGVTNGNLSAGAILAVSRMTQSLRDYGLANNMEIVENSHLWHYDSTAWMLPGEVHYTAAGYTRIARMMRDYMRHGATPVMGVAMQAVTAKPNVTSSNVQAGRVGNDIRICGFFTVNTNLGVDTDIFQLPEGVFPYRDMVVPAVSPTRKPESSINVFGAGTNRGLVRGFFAFNPGDHYINVSLPAF